jgi:hypothetical protein
MGRKKWQYVSDCAPQNLPKKMQFKSLAMIICLTAGSVLSAPINHSLDHSVERRSLNALGFVWLKTLGDIGGTDKTIERFKEVPVPSIEIPEVPPGLLSPPVRPSPPLKPSLSPKEPAEQAASSAVSQ